MSFGQVIELEEAPWPVFRVDQHKHICGVNKAASEWFGSRLEKLQLSEIWTGAKDAAQWEELWKEGASGPRKFRLIDKRNIDLGVVGLVCRVGTRGQEQLLFQILDPSILSMVGSKNGGGLPGGGTGFAVAVDVAHKQKLDCALHLTRTVALDFNNALTTILGHASFVLEKAEPNHPLRVSFAEIEKAAEKASEIAYQLALFSLDDKNKRSRTDGNLNAIVRRSVQLFQTPEHEGTNWSLQFENKLYAVSFDEAKMQQAFVKVLENAVEALGDKGGHISVQTRNLDLSEATNDRTAQLAAGSYVCVEIKDDGKGIESADLPRVFEPFFSTKHGHRGFGLAWLYGIVTNHRGGVAISSQPGHGASVRIYLPAGGNVVEERSTTDKAVGGTETILFVDDEEMVARLGEMVLSSVGYKVSTATTGEQALEILARSHGRIDLLITDMVMPHMNGRELIEKVRTLFPKTRVIGSTACVRSLESGGDTSYLQKPFTMQSLLQRVRAALDAPEGAEAA